MPVIDSALPEQCIPAPCDSAEVQLQGHLRLLLQYIRLLVTLLCAAFWVSFCTLCAALRGIVAE
jgi:hypothetical protein